MPDEKPRNSCVVRKCGDLYVIENDEGPVCTPMGKRYATVHRRLAELLRADLEATGADIMSPFARYSFAHLHAAFLDFGSKVPIRELIDNVAVGFAAPWDFMFYAGEAHDISSDSFRRWLKRLGLRKLMATQVCGGVLQSVVVPFRLIARRESAESLAALVVEHTGDLHDSFRGQSDRESRQRVRVFLSKVKRYASFPDEERMNR